MKRLSPMRQIRKQCRECCGDSVRTVRYCHSIGCNLWFLRFGKRPTTFLRENGNETGMLFDKKNFEIGGKFCPRRDESSYKL